MSRRASFRFSGVLLCAYGLFCLIPTTSAEASEQSGVELASASAVRAVAVSGATPRLIPPASMKVLPGETADQVIYATDDGGDPLTFLKGIGPDYMTVTTIDPGTGNATGRINLAPPSQTPIEPTDASVIVTDGALSDEEHFTIVSAGNLPLLIQPSDMVVEPHRVADQGLHATDADQDPLTFSLATGPWFVSVTTIGPGLGNIHLAPVLSDSGSHSVSVSVSDGIGADVRTFQVAVPSKTTPILSSVADMTAAPGQVATQSLSATDADGQLPSFYKAEGPAWMGVTTWSQPGRATGQIVLRPQFADSPSPEGGEFQFPASVGVTDGEQSQEQSFTIHVSFPPSHPPVLQQPEDMTLYEGTSAYQQLSYSDPDGEHVYITWSGADFVYLFALGVLVATPGYGDAGTYTVAVRAWDTRDLFDEKSMQIVVEDWPAPPSLDQPKDMLVFVGRAAEQDLHASDPDGYPLGFSKSEGPDYVSVDTIDRGTGTALGRISVSPTASDIGRDTVLVSVGNGRSWDSASFIVEVSSVQGPGPTLMGIGDQCVFRGDSVAVHLVAADPEGDHLSFSQTNLPRYGTFEDHGDGTATLLFQTRNEDPDAVVFMTVTVTDGHASDSEIFAVVMGVTCSHIDFGDPRNLAPTPAPGGPYSSFIGAPIAFDGTRSSDPEGQPIQYAWNLGDGSIAVGPTPTHTYQSAGEFLVELIVSDGIDADRAETTATIIPPGGGNLAATIFPNPANPIATLSFTTHEAGPIHVAAFDLRGRLVRMLRKDPTAAAGYHEIKIDGRDGAGRRLASGVYFYRIETKEGISTGRFAIAK